MFYAYGRKVFWIKKKRFQGFIGSSGSKIHKVFNIGKGAFGVLILLLRGGFMYCKSQIAARHIARERGIIPGRNISARLRAVAQTKPGLLMSAIASLMDSERTRPEIKRLTRMAFQPDNISLTCF